MDDSNLYLAVASDEEEEDTEEDKEEEDYEYEKGGGAGSKDYMRLYYIGGIGGSYFVRKADTGLKANVGAYANLDYRFSKLISVGFDSFYGWQSGSGNQYLSIFNPGFKIYPMMYKNPKFQPFLFFGGHAYDGIFGTTGYDRTGFGQGGFAGAGCRFLPTDAMIGFEFFVRSSFLYFRRPASIGGRGLVIPIFSFFGVVY